MVKILSNDLVQLKQKRDRLKAIQEIKEGLPHLYCFPFYKWQRIFWDSTKTFQMVYAANQIGKSSIMIRKIIHYATEPKMWELFPKKPHTFFYLYPDKNTATREFAKWKAEFLPRNKYKDDAKYGWKDEWEGKNIHSIAFNSGITIYFKTYGVAGNNDHAMSLQASSPSIVACDEELPANLFPELSLRIASPATRGMMWMNCTPTRGQKHWQQVQTGEVVLPDSIVQTVSMYDCLYYEDGSKSIWTKERIQHIEQTLPSQREIDIRVHGKFLPSEDAVLFPTFKRQRHVISPHPVDGWDLYCGIDYGIGGMDAHPPAITIVAIRPDYEAARIIKLWKGDDGRKYTVDDVINKYLSFCTQLGVEQIPNTFYDWACGEMGVIAENRGLAFQKADKGRDKGINLINSLFKNDMLLVFEDDEDEHIKLCDELEVLAADTNKRKRGVDDLVDSTRYSISSVAFSFKNIKVTTIKNEHMKKITHGRLNYEEIENEYLDFSYGDIDEWNEYYGE